MNYTKTIWVTASFISFHCWPEAPSDVAYLRSLHRHIFNVSVHVHVNHSDRAVEFHLLKMQVENICGILANQFLPENRSMSCEMMAEHIAEALLTRQFDVSEVRVDEDGECGAVIEINPDYVKIRLQNLPNV